MNEKLRKGGCAGIICNTVSEAQLLAIVISQEIPDADILVYHSGFISEDRTRIENQLINLVGKNSTAQERYAKKHIVIGTQVLEQSLDLDFDYLITDLCPMDVLLQRIGRLFRHKRERNGIFSEPCCAVLENSDKYDRIYEKWLLNQTEKLLPEEIVLPDDISKLVQAAYNTDDCEKDKLLEKYQLNEEKMIRTAKGIGLSAPNNREGSTIEGMMTRRSVSDDEDTALASVRCGVDSIQVYAMVYDPDDGDGDCIRFFGDTHTPLSRTHAPSDEEALLVKRQKINLPFALCVGKNRETTIEEIEKMNAMIIPEWQNSRELKGELILLLDKNFEVCFNDYKMTYHNVYGMRTEKL